ncbi:hypothetical protein [Metabacillus halosaccharovorans]|nr:hypothetical protein [Metabacillus halosaccharovorans]
MTKPAIGTSFNIEVNIREVINTCIKIGNANKGMSVSKIGL